MREQHEELPRKDGIFPGEAYLERKSAHAAVYRMDFSDGFGTMTAHSVMPGVTLILNDFHTPCGFPAEARCPGLVEINHCRAGRFSCTMRDGRVAWLGPEDFSISDMGRPPVESRFPQGLYQGISLVVEPKAAERSIGQMLGEGVLDLRELFSTLLTEQSFLLLRSEPKLQHIFSEFYDAPEDGRMAYYRLKTAELMFFLRERQKTTGRAGGFYHSKSILCRIHEIEARLTEDLRLRIPLSALSAEYRMGASTIKKYFRQIYGVPPYAYLKRRRMEEAAFLLTTTEESIAQIAEAVGYQNTSKFSAAFRDIYSISPTAYKKAAASRSVPEETP